MQQGFLQLAVFYLWTTPTVCVALRCHSLYCSLPPEKQMLKQIGVDQSLISDHQSWCRFPVCVDYLWWRRPHESSNFSDWTSLLAGSQSLCPILWRTVHCTLQVLNHLSCGFNFNFYWLEACFKSLQIQQCHLLVGFTAMMSHATVSLVMHVVLGFLLRIFM